MPLKLRVKIKWITLHTCSPSSTRTLRCLFGDVVVCNSCNLFLKTESVVVLKFL